MLVQQDDFSQPICLAWSECGKPINEGALAPIIRPEKWAPALECVLFVVQLQRLVSHLATRPSNGWGRWSVEAIVPDWFLMEDWKRSPQRVVIFGDGVRPFRHGVGEYLLAKLGWQLEETTSWLISGRSSGNGPIVEKKHSIRMLFRMCAILRVLVTSMMAVNFRERSLSECYAMLCADIATVDSRKAIAADLLVKIGLVILP